MTTVAQIVQRFVIIASIGLTSGVMIYYGLRILNATRRLETLRRDLQQRGLVTQAEITELVPPSYVKFSFHALDADGHDKSLLSFSDITAADYSRVKAGDMVQIRYLPENPLLNVIESGATESVTVGMGATWGSVLTILGVLILGGDAIILVLSIARVIQFVSNK